MSGIRVPVCVPCARTMRCAENSFSVMKMDPLDPKEPYEISYGDRYRCHGCGNSIVVGFGSPIERFEEAFSGLKDDKHLEITDP